MHGLEAANATIAVSMLNRNATMMRQCHAFCVNIITMTNYLGNTVANAVNCTNNWAIQ